MGPRKAINRSGDKVTADSDATFHRREHSKEAGGGQDSMVTLYPRSSPPEGARRQHRHLLSLPVPPPAAAVLGDHLPGAGDWTQWEGLAPGLSPPQGPAQGQCRSSAWPGAAGSHGCPRWNREAPRGRGAAGEAKGGWPGSPARSTHPPPPHRAAPGAPVHTRHLHSGMPLGAPQPTPPAFPCPTSSLAHSPLPLPAMTLSLIHISEPTRPY